jgi:flagellar basal-body rod modification protein FlgD
VALSGRSGAVTIFLAQVGVRVDGTCTISITGKDASGQTVAVPTEIEGIVDSVDLNKTPPVLSMGGQDYTIDKIKRVVRPGT